MAEEEGFEPSCHLRDNLISSRVIHSYNRGKQWNLKEVKEVLKPSFCKPFTLENRLKTSHVKGFQSILKRVPFSGEKREFGENGENLERTKTGLR